MYKFVILYQYGTYSGEKTVFADDEDQAINRMWADFRRRGLLTLSMAYQSAKIIRSEYVN